MNTKVTLKTQHALLTKQTIPHGNGSLDQVVV